ncbi:eukaryotic membrane protein family-domain-containing protein [Lipomyces oligophaga]|uniref:eukaryotic membrane protein family-domain-containing protein n=1 Tax=Lipomyces oligophaga TaxID=45792 RepID=UPI0034CDD506
MSSAKEFSDPPDKKQLSVDVNLPSASPIISPQSTTDTNRCAFSDDSKSGDELSTSPIDFENHLAATAAQPLLRMKLAAAAFRDLRTKLVREIGVDTLGGNGVSSLHESEIDQIVSFLLVPFSLEKVLFFGFLTCVDSFLYAFTILPLRFLAALFTLAKGHIFQKPITLSPSRKIDIVKAALIATTVYCLNSLNASILYHNIRGQSAVKLYVMFNVLEISDKLCSSFGQDILALLFSQETLESGWRLTVFGVAAVLYNWLHSAALFCQMITLNVAVNSYSNALLTLLLSNQFGEIKSTVFKRFERENLFQLTCSDISERFQLWAMLVMIGLRNIVELWLGGGLSATKSAIPRSWQGWNSLFGALIGPAIVVLGSEVCVDWVKHSYIAKFNKLRPKVYTRFLDVLCRDQLRNAERDEQEAINDDLRRGSHRARAPGSTARQQMSVTRRLGVPILPLVCVFVKSMIQIVQLFVSSQVMSISAADDKDAISYSGENGSTNTSSKNGSDLSESESASFNAQQVLMVLMYLAGLFVLFWILVAVKLALGAVLLEYSEHRLDKVNRQINSGSSKSPVLQGEMSSPATTVSSLAEVRAQDGGQDVKSMADPFGDEKVGGERKGGAWGLVDMSDGIREHVNQPDDDPGYYQEELNTLGVVRRRMVSPVPGAPSWRRRAWGSTHTLSESASPTELDEVVANVAPGSNNSRAVSTSSLASYSGREHYSTGKYNNEQAISSTSGYHKRGQQSMDLNDVERFQMVAKRIW